MAEIFMIDPISFFVAGVPKPAGSKRGFFIPKIKRVVITDACKGSRDWKTDVKHAGQKEYAGPLRQGALAVRLVFLVVRPKAHYRTGKNAASLRDGAPVYPTTKPDVLKLARAVEDALTGIIWRDDSQIVTEHLSKRFADAPGVRVEITEETL
jgi:crossover junction endodeoxyribonuclease RusA